MGTPGEAFFAELLEGGEGGGGGATKAGTEMEGRDDTMPPGEPPLSSQLSIMPSPALI